MDCVKRNRSQWIEEGETATNLMIQQDERERLNRSSLRSSTVSASDVTVTTNNQNNVQSRKGTRTCSVFEWPGTLNATSYQRLI